MANPSNWHESRRKAFVFRTVDLTTSASLTTYTVVVGGSGNSFKSDRVINVTTTDGNSMTITVPDGIYEGQRLLINFVTEESAETVTVTTTTGGDYSMTAAGDYCSLEWVNSTVGWIYLSEQTT